MDTYVWSDEPARLVVSDRLATTIGVRFAPEEADLLSQAAERLDMTRARFLREAGLEAAARLLNSAPPPSPDDQHEEGQALR